jgi:acetate---CoA ligase (ADP-forming)
MSESNIFEQLDPIFHPRSVALLGASGNPGKIGGVLMNRFVEMGFEHLYPVNPREDRILSIKAYPKITDIPGPVDLAIIVTPTNAVLSAVEDCTTKGVRAIVITTSGFSEAGEEGKKLEQELVRIARSGGVRIIGPNCVGIYCPSARLPFPLHSVTTSGSLGVVSQSGFFADYLALVASANGIAFSKAISCGNESDLSVTDFLEYLGEDPETKTIVAYVEGVKNGRRFYTVAKEISRRKPIILWKGGITEQGARAAASHTGSVAGSRAVWEGAMRQTGIVNVGTFEEVLDALYAFHLQPLPRGKRVGIVSGPGGMAVGATDRCLELGLEVPHLSAGTAHRLRKSISLVGGSAKNPVDLSLAALVAPRVYKDAIRILAEDDDIDMLLVISIVGGEQLREMLLEAVHNIEPKKPIVVTVMAESMQSVARDFPLFLTSGISAYPDSARAAKALSRLRQYARFRMKSQLGSGLGTKKRHRKKSIGLIRTALTEGTLFLSEHQSKEVLRAYDIPVTKEEETYDEPSLRRACARIGFPLVIKANGPDVRHKTELELIRTDVRDEHEALSAFNEIMKKTKGRKSSVLVQEMIQGQRELMVGLSRDSQFGPCVVFGLGGVLAEVFRDFSFRVAPIDEQDALDMINEIKAREIIGSFRGMPPVDIDALADILVKVGNIGLQQASVKEIDINPIIINGAKPIAVDALIVLDPNGQEALSSPS